MSNNTRVLFDNSNNCNRITRVIMLQVSWKNVKFIQKNSLNLIFENKSYDLIWIDGAHGYPILPIDISNAIRLISKEGIILCDDIFISAKIKSDNMYKSNAGIETLNVLKNAGLINYYLFYKRINFEDNSVSRNRKFLALIKNV